MAPGSKVELTVWRDGKADSPSTVELGTLPADQQASAGDDQRPAGAGRSRRLPRRRLPISASRSARRMTARASPITGVDPNSDAADKGIKEGETISRSTTRRSPAPTMCPKVIDRGQEGRPHQGAVPDPVRRTAAASWRCRSARADRGPRTTGARANLPEVRGARHFSPTSFAQPIRRGAEFPRANLACERHAVRDYGRPHEDSDHRRRPRSRAPILRRPFARRASSPIMPATAKAVCSWRPRIPTTCSSSTACCRAATGSRSSASCAARASIRRC